MMLGLPLVNLFGNLMRNLLLCDGKSMPLSAFDLTTMQLSTRDAISDHTMLTADRCNEQALREEIP